MSLRSAAQRFNVSACVSCNKCFDVCPIHWADSRFNPSELAAACLAEGPLDEKSLFTLWSCTGCRACLAKCPEGAPDFAAFTFEARIEARKKGHRPPAPYGGAMEILKRLSADHRLVQRRLRILPPKWRNPVSPDGALVYLGALPFIADIVHRELGEKALLSAEAGFKLLDALGTEFGMLDDETDCGHDLLWTGDRLTFKAHAERLRSQIEETGVDLVIVFNEETADTLRHEFPAAGYGVDAQVVTLTEFLARRADSLEFNPSQKKIALHVESRRGDQDHWMRQLVRAVEHVPETEAIQITGSEPVVHSTGVRGFAFCGGWAAALQNRLLEAAEKSGAEILITSGIDTATHLRCLNREGAWRKNSVSVMTAAEFLENHLAPKSSGEKTAGLKGSQDT